MHPPLLLPGCWHARRCRVSSVGWRIDAKASGLEQMRASDAEAAQRLVSVCFQLFDWDLTGNESIGSLLSPALSVLRFAALSSYHGDAPAAGRCMLALPLLRCLCCAASVALPLLRPADETGEQQLCEFGAVRTDGSDCASRCVMPALCDEHDCECLQVVSQCGDRMQVLGGPSSSPCLPLLRYVCVRASVCMCVCL